MELNMNSIVQIGLIVIAIMFVMKMMKGKRREDFSQQQPQNVSCNCNIKQEEPVIEGIGGFGQIANDAVNALNSLTSSSIDSVVTPTPTPTVV